MEIDVSHQFSRNRLRALFLYAIFAKRVAIKLPKCSGGRGNRFSLQFLKESITRKTNFLITTSQDSSEDVSKTTIIENQKKLFSV
jgi:hypothetical protein